jgi:glucose-6-phosphate isomerase
MSIALSPAWNALAVHREALACTHLRELFAGDPDRVRSLSLSFDGIHFDFSKQRLNANTLKLLLELAEAAKVGEWTGRMFNGDSINASEDRAVLHVALRRPGGLDCRLGCPPFPRDDFDVMPEVLATRARMADFADRLRAGQCFGHSGVAIRSVVNIGIGGSDLGPKMLGHALRAYAHPTLAVHYVSNVDGAQLATLLPTLDPCSTLFIVASKTFTTQETLLNAQSARDWLVANLVDAAAVASHFVAVTAHAERAIEFGIRPALIFPLWDWVGGRFSLWSAVGLALMIRIGPAAFGDLLKGATRMDEHFRSAPFACNLPVVMALVGIWNSNFLGAATHAVLPYSDSLAYLPAYLQQLEMESNGKSVGKDGAPLSYTTAPVLWGELGNNGQHAFFQLLHQGGQLVPCDFIAAARADFPLPGHQEVLLANCFAQSAALAFGKTEPEVRAELAAGGAMRPEVFSALLPQKLFAGNQPSSTVLLKQLDPQTLGSLLALYEHKVFVQGLIWGVNSFDQWGVELGKALAQQILPAFDDPMLAGMLDASTLGLMAFSKVGSDSI